jgi:hypothetical protein
MSEQNKKRRGRPKKDNVNLIKYYIFKIKFIIL